MNEIRVNCGDYATYRCKFLHDAASAVPKELRESDRPVSLVYL